jgi:DNA/RNA-binding domain of Phe-tRNA-synthetase-like protein
MSWAGDRGRPPAAQGEPEPSLGWLDREVERELPGLRLHTVESPVRGRQLTVESPPGVRARLNELANRVRGHRAVAARREPVPAAYRLFFRHIGLDPDVQRTPIEAALLERMVRGGFPTAGLVEDVLLISLLDTGVAVWALDAERLDGPLGIRPSREGELLGRCAGAPALPEGRLVVTDASAALAVMFGELAPGHGPDAGTRAVTLFAVQVAGVPALYVHEALMGCLDALQAA